MNRMFLSGLRHSLRTMSEGRGMTGTNKRLSFYVLWFLCAAFLTTWVSTASADRYTINARLDWDAKVIEGQVFVEVRAPGPGEKACLLLYPNVFHSNKTQLAKDLNRLTGRQYFKNKRYMGFIEIHNIYTAEGLPVQVVMNEDKTGAELRFPAPVRDGASIALQLTFRLKIPEYSYSMGYKDHFLLLHHWFPQYYRIETFREQCPPVRFRWFPGQSPHTFEISVEAPAFQTVVSTGEVVQSQASKNVQIYHFRAVDVPDFALILLESPRVREHELPDGKTFQLYYPSGHQPKHEALEHLEALYRVYSQAVQPYPHSRLTYIELPFRSLQPGGRGFPSITLTAFLLPFDLPFEIPNWITLHGLGHHFFPSPLVLSSSDRWVLEGILNYFTVLYLDRVHGESSMRLSGIGLYGKPVEWFERRLYSFPEKDFPRMEAWKFHSTRSYYMNVYVKPTLLFLTLKNIFGEERILTLIRTIFKQKADSLSQVLYEQTETLLGRQAREFVQYYAENPGLFDMMIRKVRCRKVTQQGEFIMVGETMKWRKNIRNEEEFSCTVYTQVKGKLPFPVSVEIEYADGQKERIVWNLSRTLHIKKRSFPVVKVVLDPDHVFVIDRNRVNNSWVHVPAKNMYGLQMRLIHFFQYLLSLSHFLF